MTMTIDRIETFGDTAPVPPNYLLRRLTVALAAAGFVVVVVALSAAALAGFEGAPAVASDAAPAPSAAVHVARAGDTLWSIAGEHHGEVDHRRYLDALIDLNGGTSIQAGQAVFLP